MHVVPYFDPNSADGYGPDQMPPCVYDFRPDSLARLKILAAPRGRLGLFEPQPVSECVPSGAPLPGDLAVWDGHVALVVGNGMMMVEASINKQTRQVYKTCRG